MKGRKRGWHAGPLPTRLTLLPNRLDRLGKEPRPTGASSGAPAWCPTLEDGWDSCFQLLFGQKSCHSVHFCGRFLANLLSNLAENGCILLMAWGLGNRQFIVRGAKKNKICLTPHPGQCRNVSNEALNVRRASGYLTHKKQKTQNK
jgi:hypothetical protein